jgi:hypothetical protein
MTITPKTHATQVRRANDRKAAVVRDVRVLAYSTKTGDAPRPAPVEPTPVVIVDDPHCFVCGRHTDHWGEHDDLVDAGLATYGPDGSVYSVKS